MVKFMLSNISRTVTKSSAPSGLVVYMKTWESIRRDLR